MSPSNCNNTQEKKNMPLAYALNLLSQFEPIPVHIFNEDGLYSEKFNQNYRDEKNVFKTDISFRQKIISIVKEKGATIISSEKPILYGGVQCFDGLTLIAGPIAMSDVDKNFCCLYALKHNASTITPLRCYVKKLAALILLIYASVNNKYPYLTDFLEQNLLGDDLIATTQKQLAKVINSHSIANRPHNPVSLEASIRFAISHGDIEALKKAHNSMYASMRGTVANNSLRSAKNLAIVDITIATREAIDAGLSAEELYTLSDAFILEVEEASTSEHAAAIARACALRCTQLVKESNSNSEHIGETSLVVIRACDYIDRNIYEKIDIDDLCKKIKVSQSYLSKLFKAEKKITLGAFIRQRKINVAKVLLISTDKSLSEIASSLNFTSQSHFGRVFLQLTGHTPAKYRNMHSIRDVII